MAMFGSKSLRLINVFYGINLLIHYTSPKFMRRSKDVGIEENYPPKLKELNKFKYSKWNLNYKTNENLIDEIKL